MTAVDECDSLTSLLGLVSIPANTTIPATNEDFDETDSLISCNDESIYQAQDLEALLVLGIKVDIRYYSIESYRLSYIPKYYVTRLFYSVQEI